MAAAADSKTTVKTLKLMHDKDTKRKARFTFNPEEGDAPVTGSLYVDFEAFGGQENVPGTITVQVKL